MSEDRPSRPRWVELERVVDLDEVEHLTTLSHDTIKRRYGHLLVRLSLRRVGMKLKDVLAITEGTAA